MTKMMIQGVGEIIVRKKTTMVAKERKITWCPALELEKKSKVAPKATSKGVPMSIKRRQRLRHLMALVKTLITANLSILVIKR